jgi:hypothetical protein
MTMQANHPDDERLAALAASERDALADAALVTHVADCPRCAPIVGDLRTLQSTLAVLPDIPPSRPLRFLPPVPDSYSPRRPWLGLLRGITAPAMAIAIVMIVVGAIGTAGAGLGSFGAAGAAPAAGAGGRAAEASGAAAPAALQGRTAGESASPTGSQRDSLTYGSPATPIFGAAGSPPPASAQVDAARKLGQPTSGQGSLGAVEPTRPPFEWLLGGGVVLLAAAFVVRGYVRRRSTV